MCPFSDIFTEEQVRDIPIDNKVGEKYIGYFIEQLRRNESSAFQAISDQLVLKTSADIAFAEVSEDMLRYKELKEKRKEVEQTEAEWSNAQKDAEADKLAREQSKNKLLTL